eukprot:3332850-Rhodomonas_salina.1
MPARPGRPGWTSPSQPENLRRCRLGVDVLRPGVRLRWGMGSGHSGFGEAGLLQLEVHLSIKFFDYYLQVD